MTKVTISFCSELTTLMKVDELAKEYDVSKSSIINNIVESNIEEYEKNIKNVPDAGGNSLV